MRSSNRKNKVFSLQNVEPTCCCCYSFDAVSCRRHHLSAIAPFDWMHSMMMMCWCCCCYSMMCMHLCYDDATICCPTVGFVTNSIYCHDNYLHLIADYSTVTHDRSDRSSAVLYREAVFGAYDVVPPSDIAIQSICLFVSFQFEKKKKIEEKMNFSILLYCEFNKCHLLGWGTCINNLHFT